MAMSVSKELSELNRKIKILEKENRELQKFIKSPSLLNTTLNSGKHFTILNKKEIGKVKFHGTPLDLLLGLIFLKKKYKNTCLPFKIKEKDITIYNYSIIWECGRFRTRRKLHFPRNFKSSWRKCKKRFIIVPLVLSEQFPCKEKSKNKENPMAHANFIIYDSKKKEVERFEPYGTKVLFYEFFEQDKIDSKLRKWFSNNLGIKKYYSPIKTCPRGGFQDLQSIEQLERTGDPGGFCMIWSLWYVHLRLKFPNMKRETLVNNAITKLDNSAYSRTVFIRNYTNYILNQKYKMLKHFSKEAIDQEHPAVVKHVNIELLKLLNKK